MNPHLPHILVTMCCGCTRDDKFITLYVITTIAIVASGIIGGATYANGCDPNLPMTCVKYKPRIGNITAVYASIGNNGNYYATVVLNLPSYGFCSVPGPSAATQEQAIDYAHVVGYTLGSSRFVLYNVDNGICTEEGRSKITHVGIVFLSLLALSVLMMVLFVWLHCGYKCVIKERPVQPSTAV
jgi:hypothetical protein